MTLPRFRSSTRPSRTGPGLRFCTALGAAILFFGFVVGAQSASADTADTAATAGSLPSLVEASQRADALNLPAPDGSRLSAEEACAVDVSSLDTTCFDNLTDLATWVTGDQSLNSGQTSTATAVNAIVQPRGTGGQSVGTSGVTALGLTCGTTACTNNVNLWYTPGSGTCTHSYPANDYYKNSAPTYRAYFPADADTINCNRMVAYPGSAQQGAGSQSCFMATNPNGCSWSTSMNSISWSNN